jgi:hypothetical protein
LTRILTRRERVWVGQQQIGAGVNSASAPTGVVRNKAIYLALGVLPDGTHDILGLWME